MNYDSKQDFTKYVNPDTHYIEVPDTSTIPVNATKQNHKYQDPNDPDIADPTDLQSEDEGLYEDNSEDFNGKLK